MARLYHSHYLVHICLSELMTSFALPIVLQSHHQMVIQRPNTASVGIEAVVHCRWQMEPFLFEFELELVLLVELVMVDALELDLGF